MRSVAAIPALALLGGSAIGLFLPELPHVFACALTIGGALGAAVAWRWSSGALVIGCVVVGFAAGGALLAADAWGRAEGSSLQRVFDQRERAQRAQALAERRAVPYEGSAFVSLEGLLGSDASAGPSGVSLDLAVDRVRKPNVDGWEPANGGVLVTVVGSLAGERMGQWRAGRRVRLPAELRRPTRYLNEAVPDAERVLRRGGVTLVGSTKSGALVEVVATGGWFDERAADLRAYARRAIAGAVGAWSTRSSAIVTAIVIGDRAGLDDELERRLQEAGTYHVIAISGGNIAILAGLLLGAFRLAGVLGRTAMCACIAALAAYAYLVGGGASVNRATTMAVVYLGARAFDQRSQPVNALACATACLVLIDPLSVGDPAFVLTVGATFAILTAIPATPLRRLPRILVPIAAMSAASAAIEVVLFPAGALFFSRVTFAGLGLNLLAVPLMGVAQVAGLVVVAAAWASVWIADLAGAVGHAGALGLVWSAELVRFAPALTFRLAPPFAWVVTAYYAALLVWWRSRRRSAALAVACAAIWILAQPWTLLTAGGDGALHLTFLDVGQGDAAFVRFPDGATMLVDAGGIPNASSFDIGDRVVAPVLRRAGVRRIDYLVLTHGDPDHIGGARSIVREFRPREIWEGIPVPRLEPLNSLKADARDRSLRWRNVAAGDRMEVGGVEIAVRHPGPPDWERQRVRNDDSVVLELRWKNVSAVLTGDIGRAVERTLSSRMTPAPIRVVKVPHHGSLTSSTEPFVRALAPTVAIVSAGRTNRFGHPVPEVLERYRRSGTQVFRTDRDGAITVDSDGYRLDVHTFNGTTTKDRPLRQ